MEFTVVVFDTAPTGHTLRLLTFPLMLEKALGKMLEFKDKISPYLNQISMHSESGINLEDIAQKVEELLAAIKTVNQQFKNHVRKYKIFLKQSEWIYYYFVLE